MSSIKKAVYREQLATLCVLDELVELEKTKSYLKKSKSLFSYLTKELKYSEGAAVRRIQTARVIIQYPETRELLRKREVSLCTISAISTTILKSGGAGGGGKLLNDIRGKSKREVEELLILAGKKKAPVKEQVRRLPQRKAVKKPLPKSLPKSTATAMQGNTIRQDNATRQENTFSLFSGNEDKDISTQPPVATPEEAQPAPLYRVSFTVTQEVQELMEEVKALMSHKLVKSETPVATIFEAGIKLLLKDLNKKRTSKDVAKRKSTATTSTNTATTTSTNKRYISAQVRRAVFERDNSECQYVYEDGTKCCSNWQLEVDHIQPFALGGTNEVYNLRVVCRNHNQILAYEAGLLHRAA